MAKQITQNGNPPQKPAKPEEMLSARPRTNAVTNKNPNNPAILLTISATYQGMYLPNSASGSHRAMPGNWYIRTMTAITMPR